MSLHVIQCDSGGEYLPPWARKKLSYWHQEMLHSGQRSVFKIVQVSDGRMIYTNSELVAPGVFIDKIRITAAGGPWDFHVNGGPLTNGLILGATGTLRTKKVFLGKVGAPSLRSVTLETETDSAISFSSSKTGTDSRGAFATGTATKYVNETGQVVSIVSPSLLLAAGIWTLSDGPDSRDVTAQIKTTNTVFGVGSDTLLTTFVSFTGSNYGSALFLVSLADGVVLELSYTAPVINYTRSNLEHIYTPIGSLTDVFITERVGVDGSTGANPYSLANLVVYRNGVLDFAPATQVRVRANDTINPAFAVSRDGWAAFYDHLAVINIILSPVPTGAAYLLVLEGVKNIDGTYSYAEHTVLLDAAYDFDVMGSDTAKFMTGVSLTAEYLFVRYPSGGNNLCKIIASDGATIQVPEVEVAYFVSLNFGVALSFPTRACVVGSRKDGSWTRTAFFLFSDGIYTAVTLPAAARNASIGSLSVGSNTLGYVYISDGALLKYIAISDGSLVTLLLPPAKPATDSTPEYAVTSVTVAGFVEQKVGCRLMFKATYADGSFTYHHWDEAGVVFNYGTPSTTVSLMIVPTPSAVHRMTLLDSWNA